jgi:DNA-binding transcriptional regulator LsrR (DeoR family)
MTAEPQLTRAALARRLGVSRAWVTRVLGRQSSAARVNLAVVHPAGSRA